MKQAGQICLLLTMFVWLLYQVRHSYEEHSPKLLPNSIETQEVIIKFGRKDLSNPLADASLLKGSQDEDEESGEDMKDVRVEEKEEEQEEESVLEGRGVGDDEIDAKDQEMAEEEDSESELGDLIDEEDWEKDDASLEEEIEDHSRRGNDSQDSRKGEEEGENDAQESD